VYLLIFWIIFIIYKVGETIYLNSKARKQARYNQAAEQAALRIQALKKVREEKIRQQM
jgi:hypothetical protein